MNQAVTRKDGLPDPLNTPLDQLDIADRGGLSLILGSHFLSGYAVRLQFTIKHRVLQGQHLTEIFGR